MEPSPFLSPSHHLFCRWFDQWIDRWFLVGCGVIARVVVPAVIAIVVVAIVFIARSEVNE